MMITLKKLTPNIMATLDSYSIDMASVYSAAIKFRNAERTMKNNLHQKVRNEVT